MRKKTTDSCRLGDLVIFMLGFEIYSEKESFRFAPIISSMLRVSVRNPDSQTVELCRRALAKKHPFLGDEAFKKSVAELSRDIRDGSSSIKTKRYVSQWIAEQIEIHGNVFLLPFPKEVALEPCQENRIPLSVHLFGGQVSFTN
ncbi:MAG: hypothetical protein WCL23_01915 [Candidatus Moraniibacteriota bacterium]